MICELSGHILSRKGSGFQFCSFTFPVFPGWGKERMYCHDDSYGRGCWGECQNDLEVLVVLQFSFSGI